MCQENQEGFFERLNTQDETRIHRYDSSLRLIGNALTPSPVYLYLKIIMSISFQRPAMWLVLAAVCLGAWDVGADARKTHFLPPRDLNRPDRIVGGEPVNEGAEPLESVHTFLHIYSCLRFSVKYILSNKLFFLIVFYNKAVPYWSRIKFHPEFSKSVLSIILFSPLSIIHLLPILPPSPPHLSPHPFVHPLLPPHPSSTTSLFSFYELLLDR